MAITVDTYTGHTWVDGSTPDLDALTLNETEEGIRKNNTAIKAILSALTSQITDNPDKFASIAAVYALSQSLNTLSTAVTNLNSNLVPNTAVITPVGLSFGTGTGYSYKIHKFGKIGILDINIVGQNVVKDADYTIGTLGGYIVSFSAPLIATVYDKPKSAGYHLKCDNGVLHILCGQDDAAVGVSGMIPFLIP